MRYSSLYLLVFFVLSHQSLKACGPGFDEFQGYSFLDAEMINPDSIQEYILSFETIYDGYTKGQKAQIKNNLHEWQEIFCDQVELKDLHQIIYKGNLQSLQLLRTSILSKNIPIEFQYEKNSFAQHLKRHRCEETIDYLIFAKRCEPHVLPVDTWFNQGRDTVSMYQLIKQGKKEFKKIKSNHLRLRYTYQLMRLAHYARSYREVLAIYDGLLPRTDSVKTDIYNWIEGHRAGALKKLGQENEAAYLYLQIFLNSPAKRESAFQSFVVKDQDDWQAVWLKCKDDRERAGLYALRAYHTESRAVVEMKDIYALDPNSELLEALLIREIKKLEKDFLGLEFNDHRQENKRLYKIPRKNSGRYLLQLDSLVRKVIKEEQVDRPLVWRLANGYLEFLAGDNYAASRTFELLQPEIEDEKLKEQLSLFQLALEVASMKDIQAENEDRLYEIMLRNPLYKEEPDFPDYLKDKMMEMYRQANMPGRAFRTKFMVEDLRPNPQINIIEDLLKICTKDELSRMEEALITYASGDRICMDLYSMRGVAFMMDGEMEAALEAFNQVPLDVRDSTLFNPFIIRYGECVACPLPDSSEIYTRSQIIERIFELEYKAKADFEKGDLHYFDMGNAYFNLSYFGHSWKAADYFRSGANWHYDKDDIYPLYGSPYDNKENMDLSKALFYFRKCIEVTTNPELAARAAFMGARCEHNMYYLSKDCSYRGGYTNQIPNFPSEYQNYFRYLKTSLSGTKFYERMIDECIFFRAYSIQ